MKTPMQELVDELYKLSETHVNDLEEERDWKSGLRTAAVIAESMLEKEKEAIQQAFYEGMSCQRFDPNMGRAEIYYNENFDK